MQTTSSPQRPPKAPPGSRWQVLSVPLDDPRVTPLLTDLAREYSVRYGDRFGGAEQEMLRYPAAEFAPPGGALLIVAEDGVTVAGGAFRQFNDETAELKRIWTSSSHRRKGLARFVLAELEAEARRRGYKGLYLTTGPRQPEARALYLGAGYSALFDLEADAEDVGLLAFEKDLSIIGSPAGGEIGLQSAAGETPRLNHPHPIRPTVLPHLNQSPDLTARQGN